jgi:hypothetical protein
MALTFDFPIGDLDATTSVLIHDFDGTPNLVLDRNLPFSVHAEWKVVGPKTTMLGGDWHVRALAESMGPGPDYDLGSVDHAVVPTDGFTYVSHIPVAGNTMDVGVYKLVIVITHTNTSGVATEAAGFAEGPLFQIREP